MITYHILLNTTVLADKLKYKVTRTYIDYLIILYENKTVIVNQ